VTRFAWGSATDTGRIRQANEDSLLTVDGLYAVADGMGGHQAGEVASRLALETLAEAFDAAGTEVLVAAVEQANAALVERAATDPGLAGMGTTLCAMALVDVNDRDAIAVVNVGDSRLYLLSDGELHQITEDHSLVATLQRQGRITAEEAAVHPQRNILTRALGIDGRVLVDSWEIVPVIGDRYLLCSDGLFNEVDESRIAAALRRLADPTEAAQELVRLANEAAGRDNITCVIVDVLDDAGRDPAPIGDSRITTRSAISDPEYPGADVAATAGEPGSAVGGSTSSPTSRLHAAFTSAMTWRVGLFIGSLVLLGLFVFGFIWWTGNRTYFVGVDNDQVVIYRGKPGGLLWIEPELVESTDLRIAEVPDPYRSAVTAGVEQPTLSAAHTYVNSVSDVISRQTTPTTTPGTSSTTAPTGVTSTTG
jgi:PPM family protein phosphatase